MNISITNRFFALLLAISLTFSLSFAISLAQQDDDHTDDDTAAEHDEDAHDEDADEMDDDHDDDMESDMAADSDRIEQLKTIIALLTQLAELLSQKADIATDSHVHDDSHAHDDLMDTDVDDELAIWIEIHSNRTHAHVDLVSAEVDTFFIDDYTYDQEAEIIDVIAESTGLTAEEIEAVITFPSGEVDENGDSIEASDDEHEHHDEDDAEEMDLTGIHIMSDGTIMLGSGEAVDDATITDDGMIMLADGTTVEPEFDLR